MQFNVSKDLLQKQNLVLKSVSVLNKILYPYKHTLSIAHIYAFFPMAPTLRNDPGWGDSTGSHIAIIGQDVHNRNTFS